jgi:hypothetical protein
LAAVKSMNNTSTSSRSGGFLSQPWPRRGSIAAASGGGDSLLHQRQGPPLFSGEDVPAVAPVMDFRAEMFAMDGPIREAADRGAGFVYKS